MRTFNSYLKEQDEALDGFLKNHGLDDDWKSYKNKPKSIVAPPDMPKGWKSGPEEVVKNINQVFRNIIGNTAKTNNFGLDDIEFELTNSQEVSTGIRLNMEAHGTSNARNADHVRKQLVKTAEMTKRPLAEKNIHLEIYYNKIDTNAAVEEMDEPAMGLIRKIEFRVLCVAIAKI